MKGVTALIPAIVFAAGVDPITEAWVMSPMRAGQSRPEVHSVHVEGGEVRVRSAGVSTHYLGPLQTPSWPVDRLQQFEFRFPRSPVAAPGPAPLPARVLGAFVNGVPIYHHMEAASYQGRDLWHFDTLARGRTDPGHPPAPGLIEALAAESGKHSPILGFALDGYPVYGPWGSGPAGTVSRMRSGYRLRQIARRAEWSDGTALAPGQWGPDVGAEYPLGTFAEDYEYAEGHGDLDACNGRFSRTPEYPEGTYAYFLATDASGAPAYPYLIGRCLHGRAIGPDAGNVIASSGGVSVSRAGSWLRFRIEDSRGRPLHRLESVHERPFHLLIVSDDLLDFDHVHPELAANGLWEVEYAFLRGGRWHLYCDFTPPGSGQRVERLEVEIAAPDRPRKAASASQARVEMESAAIRAGEDTELRFRLRDRKTGAIPLTWRPYLGAWGHFVLIAEGYRAFVHAHPSDGPDAGEPAGFHVHGVTDAAGPAPDVVRVPVNFALAGRYKLWAQFQVGDAVIAEPFEIRVAEGRAARRNSVPKGAIEVRIGAGGFSPARVAIPAGGPVSIAFTRDTAPNCGGKVAIPALGIVKEVSPGATVLVDLPERRPRELRFQCGMGMYRGAIVAR